MELHLKLVGIILVIIACVHVVFPSYFKWKADLAPLSLINRQLMYVHSFFIALTVLMMGLLCISSASELLQTLLGRRILAGLGFFWLVRLVFQFLVYSRATWRGRKLETIVHILFCFLWSYIAAVFIMAAFFTA